MRSDQGRPGRPKVPDFIPEELLRQYEIDAHAFVATRHRAAEQQSGESRKKRLARSIRSGFASRHLLLGLVALVVSVVGPALWLATDPSNAGLFVGVSLLTIASLALLVRETTKWLLGHREQFTWLLMEAGTRGKNHTKPE